MAFCFFDLMFMVMSWARAIMTTSKKAWTFPGRPYYYVLDFQKLIESPTTVRQKEERDIPGPPGQPRGEELPCRFLSRPGGSWGDIGPLEQPHVRKSCLAGSSLVPWPCHGLGDPGGSWHNPLSILAWRIPMDRRVWQATAHGIAKSWMWLSG